MILAYTVDKNFNLTHVKIIVEIKDCATIKINAYIKIMLNMINSNIENSNYNFYNIF